jgi:purine nucleosidase
MGKIPVLLDTDIGSDIDDAVALAYLLRKPECELLGVTTVTGDVQKRAALVEAVCHAAGRRDVPIHCGRREVLVDGPGQPNVPQFEAIAAGHPRLDRPENDAVKFLQETIRRRPGEITLLTIGPMSNAALLLALDPEIAGKLKAIVSMVGSFYMGENAEWIARVDPIATAMVYRAERCPHVSVGLDVTLQCRMAADEVRRRFVGEPLATVAKMAETWFKGASELIFHDPLAAALIFRPELCTYESGRVEVDYAPEAAQRGRTRLVGAATVDLIRPGGTPSPGSQEKEGMDRVAKTVDAAAFFEEYFSVFGHG